MTGQSGNGSMGRKKTAAPSRSIRIDQDVYDDAVIVAAHKKTYPSTIVSDILRPILREQKRELLRLSLDEADKAAPG